MKILIVEDETVAYDNLVAIIGEIDPSVEIIGNTESIDQTVKWLQDGTTPDLILMDINLSDGSAFLIFERINVDTPIIFITAYDQYAIDAFKVNSIDYLLKPIKVEDLKCALNKFNRWSRNDVLRYIRQMSQMLPTPKYQEKILVAINDKLRPITLSEVACFYSADKNTRIYLNNGECIPYPKSLDQTLALLNPVEFMRANKQYVIARSSVQNITVWFDNRLIVELNINTPERIFVSKNKAPEFKSWIIGS